MNYNNYDDLQSTRPLIFTKKVNDKSKVIPLSDIRNTLNETRHFPATTREWFNSIYAYNSGSIKNLPSADKTLSKLIKSYFNLYFNNSILKSTHLATRYRRLDLNKIFVSKAELKHTSNKVIITLYVYNEERRSLSHKIKLLRSELFPDKRSFRNLKDLFKKDNRLNWKGELLLINKEKILALRELETKLLSFDETRNSLSMVQNNSIKANIHKDITKSHLQEELMTIAYYKLLLNLNRSKFEDNFLSKLKPLISRIYNKEVEFNIVNLKTLYFNNDIFTQAVSMKLKNRDNKLLKVLKSSLQLIKLPFINKKIEKLGKNDDKAKFWLNRVKNLKVNSRTLIPSLTTSALSTSKQVVRKQDLLSELLLKVFPYYGEAKALTSPKEDLTQEVKDNTNKNLVLDSLKYKSIAGVRLEAKGRLTKRFTASRSVFKVKWKGSLKNKDSSYKGLSSVILRGHAKPNLQYSVVNSKTRNGAFGLKGWISNK